MKKYLDSNGVKKIHDLVQDDINNHHDSSKQDALEFNPTVPSGTTPTDLTGIKNGDDYYALGGGGSSVIANPTLAGTETNLTGLEVDGVKYQTTTAGPFVQLDTAGNPLSDETYNLIANNKDVMINYYSSRYYYISENSEKIIFRPISIEGDINTSGGYITWDMEINKSTKRWNRVKHRMGQGNVAVYNTSSYDDTELKGVVFGVQGFIIGKSLAYTSTAPTAANTSGRLQIVVLDSEPETKYDGYLYIITSAQE